MEADPSSLLAPSNDPENPIAEESKDEVPVGSGAEGEEVDEEDYQPARISRMRKQTSSPDMLASYRALSESVSQASARIPLSSNDGSGWLRRWQPCISWSKLRLLRTALGCLSSLAVLAIRLVLDNEPSAYVIHSYIIFVDMILIHLFTNCVWLSVSGEICTIIFFLLFHYTTETLWELLETTLLAALCSFHMINSRSKHKDHEEELIQGMHLIGEQSLVIMRQSAVMLGNTIDSSELGAIDEETSAISRADYVDEAASDRTTIELSKPNFPRIHSAHRRRVIGCCEHFFEHFLDGSAGVMYTSFLGLIIDEALGYGE